MGRVILGAVIGFIVWTIFLLSSDAALVALSPDWYGRHQNELQTAFDTKTPLMADSAILLMTALRSAIFSVVTGFIAAWIAQEHFKSPLLLGIFLLAFGSFVQLLIWNYVPLWYHALILLPLIPLTLLGGKLRRNLAASSRGEI